jgi:spoIIIJ-associated protein
MENNTLVQQTVQDLLEKIGIQATASVTEDENGYHVALDTQENALLIGKHGNTLSSLEYVLGQMVAAKQEEYKRVIVEVGGYREEREAYLHDLATRLKEEVVATGMEKTIRGLKPWERRLVHMMLVEDADVTTESSGEDRDRVLVIRKK